MAKMGGVNGHKLKRQINSDAALQRLAANCGDLKTFDWYGQEEAIVTLQLFGANFTRLQTHLVTFATELFLLCPWALVFHKTLLKAFSSQKEYAPRRSMMPEGRWPRQLCAIDRGRSGCFADFLKAVDPVSVLPHPQAGWSELITLYEEGCHWRSLPDCELCFPATCRRLPLNAGIKDAIPYHVMLIDAVRERATVHGRLDLPDLQPFDRMFPDLPLGVASCEVAGLPVVHAGNVPEK